MPDSRYIAKVRRRKTFWNNVTRVVIQLFVWTGAAVLYYFAFSIFWRAMKFAKENRTPVLFDY